MRMEGRRIRIGMKKRGTGLNGTRVGLSTDDGEKNECEW